ncbi:Glycosyl hydrolase, BNR repeat precursor [Minicystis rosea]|nr:Glycosyl hydrolase, BNR repeat precursor [Minicystis rosea]
MRRLSKEVFAAWTAMGLALAACNGSVDPGGDTGTVGEGAGAPVCQASLLAPEASFTRTSGPDRASFLFVAASPDVVIASTGTGLHRSKDGGDTWSFIDADELRDEGVVTIAALGKDLFVATYTTVFRSTDGGDTWSSVATEACTTVSYLSTHGSSLFAAANGQAFRWNATLSAWDALPAAEALFDVVESDGTWLYANSIYVPGVYRLRLDDPEAGWQKVEGLSAWGYHAFAFTSKGAFTANDEHIFRSDDGGVTWSTVDTGPLLGVADLLVTGDTLLAATDKGLQVSTDHGTTWKNAWAGSFGSSAALASDGKHLFAASNGLQRSAGPSEAWSRLPVFADDIQWLTATETAVINISGGAVQRTTDQGLTWTDVDLAPVGDSTYFITPVVARDHKLFGIAGGSKLLVSSDDGASFQAMSLPPAIADGYANVIANIDRGLVIGVSKGAGANCNDAQDITTTLYVSTDEGKTWVEGLNGFPITFVDCYDKEYTPMISSIVQSGKTLLATSLYRGAYRSDNDGYSWQKIDTSGDIGTLRDFVTIGDTVFAASEHGGVARSADRGKTWEMVGLAKLPVATFAVVGDTLFAGVGQSTAANDGVYGSADLGKTWARIDTSFNSSVGPLAVQGRHILAGTTGESIWSLDFGCAAQ